MFSAAVAGFVGWLYLYFKHGEEFAVAEIPFMVGALVGTSTFVLVLFFWNLACAPYRIERDAHAETLLRTKELEKAIPKVPTPRHLNADQQAVLTNAIRKSGVTPDDINVLYFNASEESANYATEIGEAVSAVPIGCTVHNGGMFSHNPKDRGVKIYCGDDAKLRTLADKLQDAFEKIGVATELRDTSDNSKSIYIYVARSA